MMNRGNQKYNKSSHFKLLLNILKSNCNVVEKYLSSFVDDQYQESYLQFIKLKYSTFNIYIYEFCHCIPECPECCLVSASNIFFQETVILN